MALLDQFDGYIPRTIPTSTEPQRCINCDETSLLFKTKLDSDFTSMWREVECLTCKTTWAEVYLLSHIEGITVHNDQLKTTLDR